MHFTESARRPQRVNNQDDHDDRPGGTAVLQMILRGWKSPSIKPRATPSVRFPKAIVRLSKVSPLLAQPLSLRAFDALLLPASPVSVVPLRFTAIDVRPARSHLHRLFYCVIGGRVIGSLHLPRRTARRVQRDGLGQSSSSFGALTALRRHRGLHVPFLSSLSTSESLHPRVRGGDSFLPTNQPIGSTAPPVRLATDPK
jgi:hypothetical protein